MDLFFRDSIKTLLQKVPDDIETRPLVDEESANSEKKCSCYNFIADVAYGHKKMAQWRIRGCIRGDPGPHECVCHLGGDQLIFGCLSEGCRALNHACVCATIVVPSEEEVAKSGNSALRPGYTSCRAYDRHFCICSKFGTSMCRVTPTKR